MIGVKPAASTKSASSWVIAKGIPSARVAAITARFGGQCIIRAVAILVSRSNRNAPIATKPPKYRFREETKLLSIFHILDANTPKIA